MQFAGHILDAQGVGNPRPELVLGTIAQLGQILDDNVIDEVIFAVPRERLAHIEGAFRLCQEQGANARFCLDLFDVNGAHVALGQMDGLPMLSFSSAPTDEVALLFKRAFDVLSSAVAVLLLSPAFIADGHRRQARLSGTGLLPPDARREGTAAPSRCSSSAACTSTPRLAWSRCARRTRPPARSSR